MKPITLEPNSGTKHAGKWIKPRGPDAYYPPRKIMYVGRKYMLLEDQDGEESFPVVDIEWFELEPHELAELGIEVESTPKLKAPPLSEEDLALANDESKKPGDVVGQDGVRYKLIHWCGVDMGEVRYFNQATNRMEPLLIGMPMEAENE